jgi:hypothetical protein
MKNKLNQKQSLELHQENTDRITHALFNLGGSKGICKSCPFGKDSYLCFANG